MNRWAENSQFFAACGIFLIGSTVYLFDRSGSDIYFIPAWWQFADGTPGLFGALGHNLPSFAHTCCFILLTSALLTPWGIAPLSICLTWCAVEVSLELAQVDLLANKILAVLPPWLADWPVLENIPGFFSRGQFDPFDLIAIGLGGAVAWLIIVLSNSIGANK
jgi:hypothetical protein